MTSAPFLAVSIRDLCAMRHPTLGVSQMRRGGGGGVSGWGGEGGVRKEVEGRKKEGNRCKDRGEKSSSRGWKRDSEREKEILAVGGRVGAKVPKQWRSATENSGP